MLLVLPFGCQESRVPEKLSSYFNPNMGIGATFRKGLPPIEKRRKVSVVSGEEGGLAQAYVGPPRTYPIHFVSSQPKYGI